MNSLIPLKVTPENWYKGEFIEDIDSLRPRPKKDILLVVGDSTGVWDDLEAFYEFAVPHDTMCLNNIATIFPFEIQHFVAGDSHNGDMQDIAKSLPDSVLNI